MEKVNIKAVIPVASYANIQPEIEVEAPTYDEALKLAEERLRYFWDKYSTEKTLGVSKNTTRLKDFFGNEIDFDSNLHQYSWNGVKYLSGSEYANSFKTPFDKEAISTNMALKYGVDKQIILDSWDLKREVSIDLGNSIHKALQLAEQHKELSKALSREVHIHDHPVIKKAVEGFILTHNEESVWSEVLIVDHKNQRAGRIDRLVSVDKDTFRVQDFKTNADVKKELEYYWKQLEFYAGILTVNGASVTGLDIFHWNGDWKTYSKELLNKE